MTKLDDNTLITKALLQRFEAEAVLDGGDGRHYAIIQRSDGNVLVHHPGSPQLDPMQQLWAYDVLRLINREIHHDGAWVILFTHPQLPSVPSIVNVMLKHWEYRRYAIIWLDADGDAQFTVEWAHGEGELYDFADVMLAGIHSTAQKCEAAWATWRLHMRDVLDPQAGQLFKRAKGEVAPSSGRH